MSLNGDNRISASITDVDVEASQMTKMQEKLISKEDKTNDAEYLEPINMSVMTWSEWFWVNTRIFIEETAELCFFQLKPEEAWPPKWGPCLLYNPLWWMILIIALICMFCGILVHYPFGMALPPRHETRSERRLRIQWIYLFNSYLAVFFLVFVVKTILYAVNNPNSKLDFYIGALVISFVWFFCQSLWLTCPLRKE